jgi:hypothetical protein
MGSSLTPIVFITNWNRRFSNSEIFTSPSNYKQDQIPTQHWTIPSLKGFAFFFETF